jgi:hypothetical protein
MLRVMKVLLLGATMIAFIAPPASAAQVTHVRLRGGFAEASWSENTATSQSGAFVEVSSRYGELFFDQYVNTYDENGNFVSETFTSADVFSGFTFTIDKRGLTTASLSATDVPATTCIDFDTCTETTVDLHVTWTGQGSIARYGSTDRFVSDGYVVTEHFVGTSRDATAAGTIGDVTWTASQLNYADIGQAASGETDVCIGSGC